EDAPQQKLSLFQIRAADATYIAQKQLAEATKQVTITNSRAKNLTFAFAPGSAQAHDIVSVKDSYGPGTIVIRTGECRLYYFLGAGEAIRYPVGVGRAGMQWSGTAVINGKYIEPARPAP